MISAPRIRRYLVGVCVVFTLLLSGGSRPIRAQEVLCVDLIDRYRSALAACNIMNNNDVCYGQVLLEALPAIERFERPRDRMPITAVNEIIARNDTGAVLMYLSVGEADPVKVITIGDVDLLPDEKTGNVNSFTFTPSRGDSVCEATPPGLLVYTETGEQGLITVNGIDVELGSIAFIALDDPDSVMVTNLEGSVRIHSAGVEQTPAVGDAALLINSADGPEFVGTPAPSNVVESELVDWLAFNPDGLPSVINLNETVRGCNLNDVNVPYSDELRLYAPGQECQITFCTAADDIVSLELQALDPQIDPWLDLRKPDTRLLTYSDDRAANNQNALICNQRLPVDGCYTVVARSYRNESSGRFRLLINGETDCEPPEAICEVVYPAGLNLRATPDQTAPLIKALPQGARLLPISQSEDGLWLEVQAEGAEEVGWVWSNPETVSCGGEIPTATPTPKTPTPTPTTPPTPKTPTPPTPILTPGPTKISPFDPP